MTAVRDATAGFERLGFDDDRWRARLKADATAIESSLPGELSDLHREVVRRARSTGVSALVLSGSTTRCRRTDISDLDYHVIGPSIEVDGLSRELDMHVLSEQDLRRAIVTGDDFAQWSLRFGWVVFDNGVLQEAVRLIVEQRPWPDVERKRAHASKSMKLAVRFVESGDEDAALLQVRTALSLAARARLLAEGIFPLSRAELPRQLEEIGSPAAARALDATIYGSPSLIELAQAVKCGEVLLESPPPSAAQAPSRLAARAQTPFVRS